MTFNAYKLFNRTEFEALGVPSRTLHVNLENVGVKDVLVTIGNELEITYEGEFLIVNFAGKNPNSKNGFAVWEDENGDVYLGIQEPEGEA